METKTGTITNPALAQQLLDAIDEQFGLHPGFRPAHAKGLMCSGIFTPSAEAATLTRAPHANRPSTAVTVRYSNSTGIPNIPDNDPRRSSPRGMAIRFHLGSTIILISSHTPQTDSRFVPARSSWSWSAPAQPSRRAGPRRSDRSSPPTRTRSDLSKRPSRFRPVSRGRPSFAVTSFKFTNAAGLSRHGRFRIRPEAGTEYLSDAAAAAKSPDFLFDEIGPRLAKEPVKLGVFVQMAEPGDDVTDASVTWPDDRTEIPFGTITLTARVDDQAPDRRKIIFDPIPRVDGIDSSGDPLTQVRADIYLLSGRRRRAVFGDGRHEDHSQRPNNDTMSPSAKSMRLPSPT
jgi:catalase